MKTFLRLCAFVFAAAAVPAHAYEVLDNGKLRFGTGSEASVNTNGNFQQPFYYDGHMSNWYPLTYSNYPLDNAVGIDGDGSSEWNLNGYIEENGFLTNQVLDTSGFIPTSGSAGYGTIVSTGTLTINGKTLEMKNTYTLGQTASFVKIVTRIKNTSGAAIQNIRVWVGTRDDNVSGDDQPLKEKGNLDNGQFVVIQNPATRAQGLMITANQAGVLFYSTSPKANTAINYCCWFSQAYSQDPFSSSTQLGGDGSYALFVRMNDLAPGASEEFTWFYAAGEVANLTNIANEVGQQTQNFTVTATAGTGGSISPGSVDVAQNGTTSFTVTPSTGYSIGSVTGCGGSLNGNTFTTGAITAACTVTASFTQNTYTVSTSAGTGGSIGPSSASVAHGNTTSFTLTPQTGYSIGTVSGCGGSRNGNTYTTGTITGACTVTASFTLNSYIVTANAGTGGSIGPSSISVNHGSSENFTVTPSTGYNVASVTGCGGTLMGTTFTTGAVTGACTITASFVLKTYSVTASAGAGGGIGPGSTTVIHGNSTSFTVTPSAGYNISTVSGCGGSLSGNTFTTGTITDACAVTASFVLKTYTVSATAGTGGSIGPANTVVNHGSSANFTVTADTGYNVDSVTGCGGTLMGSTFTTGAVTGACTVTASFSLKHYTVTASAGQGGSVSPGSASVEHGSTTSFTLTSDTGYGPVSAQGCGGSLSGNTFTTGAITGACSVAVEFAQTKPVFNPAQPATYDLNADALSMTLPENFAPQANDYAGTPLTVTLVGGATRFAPGEHVLTWRTVDSRGVAATVQQTLRVWPTVSMGKDVSLGFQQGNSGSFRIVLNGPSPVYPFNVSYTVSGYSTGHDLTSGMTQFLSGETEKDIYLAITETAAAGSPTREINVALNEGVNRGDRRQLKISLLSANVAPIAKILASQAGQQGYAFGRTQGVVTLSADIQDPNPNDTHTVQWQSPNGAIATSSGTQLTVQADSLPVGVHRFDAVVTDNGTPALSTTASFELVLRDAAPVLPDGVTAWADNGLPDDPAYNPPTRNVLPERGGELHHFLIEGDPGVKMSLGSLALLEGRPQAQLQPGTSVIGADTIANVGGYFDFTVSELPVVGQSVNIIVPQHAPVPVNAVYRKYNTSERRWFNFVEDGNNRLASAPGEEGFCPPPGSDAYRPGLNVGDWCVRLTIKDGGPNDDDGQANGAIMDPGGVASLQSVVVTASGGGGGSGGGGSFDFLLLILGAGLFMLRWMRKRVVMFVLPAAALPALALAQESASQAAETPWYVGASIGLARGEIIEDDINARLEASDYDAVASFDDRSRTAFRVFGGYRINSYLALQLGYTDLGDIESTLTGNVADIEEFLSSTNRLQPRSADGIELSAVGRYPLGTRFALVGRAGVLRWDSKYRSSDNATATAGLNTDGSSGFVGAGVEFTLTPQLNLAADWTRYRIDGEGIQLGGLGLNYRFQWGR